MMKLYYSPGACSLATHILLKEVNAPHEEIKVDLRTKKTADGQDFMAINPKGYVPALEIEQGKLLTEDGILLQYIADQHPDARLIGKAGSWERIRQLEMVHFIATELHKTFGPLWDPTTPEDVKQKAKDKLKKRLEYLDKMMEGKPFVMGTEYTLADPYLFTMMTWVKKHKIEVDHCRNLQAHFERIQKRPATEQTMKAENLH